MWNKDRSVVWGEKSYVIYFFWHWSVILWRVFISAEKSKQLENSFMLAVFLFCAGDIYHVSWQKLNNKWDSETTSVEPKWEVLKIIRWTLQSQNRGGKS